MKSLSDIQDQKLRHRSSVKTEDGFYVHYLGQNYWFGEVFVEQLNGHHETFEAQFIKLIISGEMPIGPESHQDSRFWSNKQLFSDSYCERPCRVRSNNTSLNLPSNTKYREMFVKPESESKVKAQSTWDQTNIFVI